MFSSPTISGGGMNIRTGYGSPVATTSVMAPPAMGRANMTVAQASPLDSFLKKIGIKKSPEVPISVSQQDALLVLQQKSDEYDRIEQAVKLDVAKRTAVNPNDPCVLEAAKLRNIKMQRSRLSMYGNTILKQQQTIDMRRLDADMMAVLGRGNAEIRRENDRVQSQVDASAVSDDLDDLLGEAVDDQLNIYDALNNADSATDDRLSDVRIMDTSSADGFGTIGDVVSRELDEIRAQASAQRESEALQLREELPATHVLQPVRSPILATRSPMATSPSLSMSQNVPISVSTRSFSASSSSSSSQASPFVRAHPQPSAVDEDDWLQ